MTRTMPMSGCALICARVSYVAMMRSRIVVLALLLVGSAVSVIVYQLSNTEIRTKILPSHPNNRKSDVLSNDDNSPSEDEDTTADPPLDTNLENLGSSRTAQVLRLQAIQNRKEAAYIAAARKRLDSEMFQFKVEKSQQAGLRKKIEDDLENLKLKQRLFEEEKKQFAIERIFNRCQNTSRVKRLNPQTPTPKSVDLRPSPDVATNTDLTNHVKVHRNPLSVQGAHLKDYLKKMNKNFPARIRGDSPQAQFIENSNSSHEQQKTETPGQFPQLVEGNTENKGQALNSKLSLKLDGSILNKLPKIDDFVQQGHFGYEHGRNGKASSRQETEDGVSRSNESRRKGVTPVPSKSFDENDIWEGLDPADTVRRYQGVMLDGNYMLRPFIDPTDKRASGMEGKPTSIGDMIEAAAEERFYQLVTIDHMHCGDMERMGNYADGGWDICVSAPYKPKRNCLVYSFGINNDFSFDDAISSTYGCEVKAFDPSMFVPDEDGSLSDMNVGDHMHSSKVHFFNLGLGPSDGINNQAWQLRTFGSILKRLGHSNHIIDYLKVDIEFNEWECFKTMLEEHSLKNVKQFVFEIHTSEVYTINRPSRKENFLAWYNVLLGIEKQGFRRYHHHFNSNGQYTSVRTGKDRTCCYELYYVNIRFLK